MCIVIVEKLTKEDINFHTTSGKKEGKSKSKMDCSNSDSNKSKPSLPKPSTSKSKRVLKDAGSDFFLTKFVGDFKIPKTKKPKLDSEPASKEPPKKREVKKSRATADTSTRNKAKSDKKKESSKKQQRQRRKWDKKSVKPCSVHLAKLTEKDINRWVAIKEGKAVAVVKPFIHDENSNVAYQGDEDVGRKLEIAGKTYHLKVVPPRSKKSVTFSEIVTVVAYNPAEKEVDVEGSISHLAFPEFLPEKCQEQPLRAVPDNTRKNIKMLNKRTLADYLSHYYQVFLL